MSPLPFPNLPPGRLVAENGAPTVNVVTYCRVFSEEQAQKDISIPAQRKARLRWVDDREDHQLVGQFVDEGESAYAPADKRPGFCEMISFCRRHDVDHILVHKLDCFSRNREESILFKSLPRRHGVTGLRSRHLALPGARGAPGSHETSARLRGVSDGGKAVIERS